MGCKYCPLLLCRGMFGIDLTESAPFTCLLIFFLLFFFFFFFFAALLSSREGSHSSRLPLYSRLGFGSAESLAGPKVTLLSDNQGLSLARREPHNPWPPPWSRLTLKDFIFFLLLNFRFLCVIIGLGAYCLCVKDRVGLAMRGRWKKV